MDIDRKYLAMLERLLEGTTHKIPFWLEDLLLLGPRFEEWQLDGMRPSRMFLTEMLARWLKSVGLSETACLEWLMPYCCEVLARTSKTDPSGIRHGTKCNTRWVYKSDFPFDFNAIVAGFDEATSQYRPAYMPVFARWWDLLLEAKDKARREYKPPVFTPVLPVKQRYREQFEKGIALAREKSRQGATLGAMVQMLSDQGYLSRTGRKWTQGMLYRELRNG